MQQVFLYLAARNAFSTPVPGGGRRSENKLARYNQLARLLAGGALPLLQDRVLLLVLATSAFGNEKVLVQTAEGPVSADFLKAVADVSPATAMRLWQVLQ